MRIALLFLVLAAPALAQPAAPCDSTATAGLAFWIGTWDLELDTQAGPATGTNTITRDHLDCVVRERFQAAAGYAGESVSVRTPAGWRQTWVDNSGGYLTFTGETDTEGRVIAMHQPPFTNPQGQTQHNRMIWEDITHNGFTWRWQASTDNRATWTDSWVIRYSRAEG